MLVVLRPLLGACADFDLANNYQLIERTSTVEPGAGITFELTHNQGAALITKYPTYREDVERELTFEDYIRKHYQSWVDFSRERGYGKDIRPILVTGVDLTRDFATVAYSDNRTRMRCNFSAAVPAVASASASVWGSWRTEGLVHTNCGPYPAHTTQGDHRSSESSTSDSTIPDGYNQCVFIRYYTIRRRLFIPMVIKAGAGPHQLPEPDPRGDLTGEEGLQLSSDEDSMEVDDGPMEVDSDEVVHNVPLVCPERCPCPPLLTNWTKDDRDGFDVVAEFIFQVRKILLRMDDTREQTQFSRDPRRNQCYYIITTFKTFFRYDCTLTPISRSLWSRRMKKRRYGCLLRLGWSNGLRLTKMEVSCSSFLRGRFPELSRLVVGRLVDSRATNPSSPALSRLVGGESDRIPIESYVMQGWVTTIYCVYGPGLRGIC
jgi:hypothetical protein